MRARRLARGVYRRGDVLWIRFVSAGGKLTRESTGQRDVKVAEAILAKRRSEVAMLSHFPTRKFGKPFRTLVRSLGLGDLSLHDLRHTGPSVLLMQGIPGDVVRKITGHRSRELERYQHLSPAFRAQTVDLIAQVLSAVSYGPTGNGLRNERDSLARVQRGGERGDTTQCPGHRQRAASEAGFTPAMRAGGLGGATQHPPEENWRGGRDSNPRPPT